MDDVPVVLLTVTVLSPVALAGVASGAGVDAGVLAGVAAGVAAGVDAGVAAAVGAGVAAGVAAGVLAGVALGAGVAAAGVAADAVPELTSALDPVPLVSAVPVVSVAVDVVCGGGGGVSASEVGSGENVFAMYSPIV